MSPQGTRKLRIFMASPGDVGEERQRLKKVVDALNQPNDLADRLGLTLQLLDWRQVVPDVGRPEGIILEQLPVESWDIFVGMLWLRFGTATGAVDPQTGPAYDSGTYEEFVLARRAHEATGRPRILLYRCKRDAPLAQIDLEQYEKVQAFWKEFQPEGQHPGLPQEYDTPDNFADRVHADLRKLLFDCAEWKPIGGPTAERKYLEWVMETCNELQLQYIKTQTAGAGEMTLDGVYTELDTDVFQPLEDEEEGKAAEGIKGARAMRVEERERLTALQLANQKDRLVLLGEAGSGKSTFVKYLALHLAGQRKGELPPLEGWEHGPLIPLVVTLREFADSSHFGPTARALWKFVAQMLTDNEQGDVVPHLRRAISDGEAVIMLDGLDEVARDEQREQIKEAVLSFDRAYRGNRYLVTCRDYAYRQGDAWLLGDRYPAHMLQPFDPEKREKFIHAWYTEAVRRSRVGLHEAEERRDNLIRAVRERTYLDRLSQRPLLLTNLALLNESYRDLPDNRAEIYSDMVDLLMRRWEEKSGARKALMDALDIPGLLMKTLRCGLNHVAYVVHKEQGQRSDRANITESQLVGVLKHYLLGNPDKALTFAHYVRDRAGLLSHAGRNEDMQEDIYTFPHRTYQEYLAGCYLAEDPGQLADHVCENFIQWREVFLLAAGEASAANALAAVGAICPETLTSECHQADRWQMARLAAEALLEISLPAVEQRREGPIILKRVRHSLKALLEAGALEARERAAAGHALARLGDPRRGAGVREGIPDLLWCPVPAGDFIMGSDKEHDPDAYGNELPQHPQPMPHDYLISRYPITNEQFQTFVDDPEGYRNDLWWTQAGLKWRGKRVGPEKAGGVFDLPNHPVVGVTWYEALAFCRWFTRKMQEAGSKTHVWRQDGETETRNWKPGTVIRLPTEAEWEKAARFTDGRIYPWAGEFEAAKCNMSETGIGATSAVGLFPAGASPYGVLDMSGNVWEWCLTQWADNYEGYAGKERGLQDVEGEAPRVLRGGAWRDDRWGVRCACRYWLSPDYRRHYGGFRVVAVS